MTSTAKANDHATACALDAEFVNMARAGQDAGYNALVDRHLPALVGFLKYLGAPSSQLDDIVQETFTKAFRNLTMFDTGRSFSTWILTIGRNAFYDHCRKNSREREFLKELPTEQPKSVEDSVVGRHTLDQLLEQLSEDAKLLVELRVFREMPFSEMAEFLACSEGALRVKFHRVMKSLRVAAERFTEERSG